MFLKKSKLFYWLFAKTTCDAFVFDDSVESRSGEVSNVNMFNGLYYNVRFFAQCASHPAHSTDYDRGS